MTNQENSNDSDIIIDTTCVFEAISFDVQTDRWVINFNDNISFSVTSFWRLLENGRIKFVSLEQGQQFGLPKPIDLPIELTGLLKNQKLTQIKISKYTSDLTLTFAEHFQIDIYISSGGHESYDFIVNGQQYIGMGMGEIAVFSA
jgi:hypothetical protein